MSRRRANLTPKKASAGEWKPVFLRTLAKTGNVLASCRAAKVSRQVAYQHRNAEGSNDFRMAWDEAMEDACDALEEIARKRAARESDTLLIFLLKAHRPDKFRERYEVKNTGEVAVSVRVIEEIVHDRIDNQGAAVPQAG